MSIRRLFRSVLSKKSKSSLTMLQSDFYPIYVKKIYPRCVVFIKNRYGWLNDWELQVEDMVINTFIEYFYTNPNTLINFNYEDSWGEEMFINKLLAWLTKIIFNKLIDHFIELVKNNKQLEYYKYYRQSGLDREATNDPKSFYVIERPILERAMNQLTPRQRDILLTYIKYDCFIDSNKKLPREIIQNLCDMYNITPENVRKIKIRSWVIIQNYCFRNLGNKKK